MNLKKKNEVNLQEETKEVRSLREKFSDVHLEMNIHDQFIHRHEHVGEISIQEEAAEADASMHAVSEEADTIHESINCLEEQPDEMISDIREMNHQFTLLKNDLQTYLAVVQNIAARMDEIEKVISELKDDANGQTKEKRRNYPYVIRKKEDE